MSGGIGAITLRVDDDEFDLDAPDETQFGADIGFDLMTFAGNSDWRSWTWWREPVEVLSFSCSSRIRLVQRVEPFVTCSSGATRGLTGVQGCWGVAMNGTVISQQKQPTSMTSDMAGVRALYAQLMQGWNRGNGEAFAAPFMKDGDLIGVDGVRLHGQNAIARFHDPLI